MLILTSRLDERSFMENQFALRLNFCFLFQVLADDGKTSVAVRLALGETQIVTETRKFLIENGVQLDAFNKVRCSVGSSEKNRGKKRFSSGFFPKPQEKNHLWKKTKI